MNRRSINQPKGDKRRACDVFARIDVTHLGALIRTVAAQAAQAHCHSDAIETSGGRLTCYPVTDDAKLCSQPVRERWS